MLFKLDCSSTKCCLQIQSFSLPFLSALISPSRCFIRTLFITILYQRQLKIYMFQLQWVWNHLMTCHVIFQHHQCSDISSCPTDIGTILFKRVATSIISGSRAIFNMVSFWHTQQSSVLIIYPTLTTVSM